MNTTISKRATLISLIIIAGVVSGCADTRRALIKEKGAPDEFQVYTRAPLSLPPDYGLRPPAEAGTQSRSADDPTIQARVAITGKQPVTREVQSSSPGLAAIYSRTGVNNADPNIRQLIDRETTSYAAEDATVMEDLMFGDDAQKGIVVDPATEAARIRDNQAKGIPLNEGGMPKIERKKKSLIEGVFN